MTLALVTGAAGAIGRYVVRQLAQRGDRVIGIGHGTRPPVPLEGWINGDVTEANLSVLVGAHGVPALTVHLAGGSSVGPSLAAPAEDFARTVGGTVNLLDWTRRNAPETVTVLASSAAVYGDANASPVAADAPRAPLSPYGNHKAMMEMAAASYGRNFALRTVCVRLFSVYGDGLQKQLVWEVLNRIARGERDLALGGTGRETRDWVDIGDAAAMLLAAAAQASAQSPRLNGATGVATSVADTVNALARGCGFPVSLRFDGRNRPGDPLHLVGTPSPGLAHAVAPIAGLEAFAAAFSRR
jgi:UDP-glucose 4-epimerase